MKKKGLLIVLSGPSGAGKGTICKEYLKSRENVWLSVSATTRSPRDGEVQGKNYFFIAKEEFERGIEKGEFFEYAQVYGNYYGTPKQKIMEKLDQGIDVILEIDIQGAMNVKKVYSDGVFVFILPPSMEELKRRIIGRGSETEESLDTRFKSAYKELNFVSEYDYAVINDVVESAAERIEHIIEGERYKVKRMRECIIIKECEGND
jgi:guanylate kinase